jgi:hypothetical protein
LYLRERVADNWMDEYVLRRGAPEVTGYHSADDEKGLSWSLRDQLPAANTKPASLWQRPVSNAEGEEQSTVQDYPTARLALVHQKGRLFCANDGQTTKTQNEECRYKVFFAETGRKNTLEYSVPVTWTRGTAGSETAVIDLKRMRRNGAPKQTGAAILLSVIDQLHDRADCLLIKNPPRAFVDLLHKEQWVEKTRAGYRMETQDLKRFLEGRLELAQ